MPAEFSQALYDRLTDNLSGVRVGEGQVRYTESNSGGTVVYDVSYASAEPGNNRIQSVVVDVEIWKPGPDKVQVEQLAAQVEALLVDWSVTTDNQGAVRLTGALSRTPVNGDDAKMAQISMRFNGRSFRRV